MPTKSKVVHCKREPYDRLIDRTTDWGNPFSHKDKTRASFIVSSRKESIKKFETWIRSQPKLIAKIRNELEGQILGCWCKPKQCHGDVYIKILNEASSNLTRVLEL